MATYNADNYSKVSYMGEYGNKSFAHAAIASVGAFNGNAGLANGDQVNLFQIPAGAKSIEGFLYVGSQAMATSTVFVGIKYADGTSTGGSTGSGVFVAGTASAVTAANTRYQFRFTPFTLDADAIVYLSWVSPGAPTGAGYPVDVVLTYNASGTK